MKPEIRTIPAFRRFLRDSDGAVLVEFAMVLPMMLLVFAVIVEGSRMLMSYQSAMSSVRDATRYLARIVPTDICVTGASISAYDSQVNAIANQSLGGVSLPGSVTVQGVTSSLACVSGGYRVDPAPVATVTATFAITMPFSGIFTLNGGSLGTITTSVTDTARVFGT
jgi:Flp pilus assembly protein TadG